MRYKPKSGTALHIALGGLPAQIRVEVDPEIEVSAKPVGELRKVTAWPENLAVTKPQGRDRGSLVKVSRASVATRTTPKSYGAGFLCPGPRFGVGDRRGPCH